MLRHRLIFGTLLLGFLLVVLWADALVDQMDFSGTWLSRNLGIELLPTGLVFFGLVLISIILMAGELQRLFQAKGADTSRLTTTLSAVSGCVLMYAAPPTMSAEATLALFATVLVMVFLFSLLRHCWGGITEGSLHAGGAAGFAFVYLGVLLSFYLIIRRSHSPWLILAIIVIIKCSDIGAYFVGKSLGRHKLIPWLSPGKTWEGLLGGVIFAAIVGLGLTALGNTFDITGRWIEVNGERTFEAISYPLWFAFLAGMVMAVAGQFGDLVASLLKRDAGLKDSGNTIPGFGGLLDVVDSPIVVAPLAYWLIQLAEMLGG